MAYGKCHSPFKSQPVWQFSHPLAPEDLLCRKAEVSWGIKEDICLHGFEGSFDCNLYGRGYFSIVPENKDKHFYSWFPLFFAFREEEAMEAGEMIVIELIRNSSETKVWYEWSYLILDWEGKARKQSVRHNKEALLAIQLESADK